MPALRGRLRSVTLFVVVQLLLAGVILEGGLRLARWWHDGLRALLYSPTVRTEYDDATSTRELLERSYLGFHPHEARAGFVLNSRGFRTPEYAPQPRPGSFRVVILGDSFAFASGGVPWSAGWPALLEEGLVRRRRGPAEVINLGVPAVGPRFELRLWELEGARLSPEVVLLAFFVGNDFTDESGTPLQTRRESALARWSLTWRLIRNLWRVRWEGAGGGAVALPADTGPRRFAEGGVERPQYRDIYREDRPLLSEAVYLEIERGRLQLVVDDQRETFERLFEQVRRVLIRLHRSVRAQGAELVMVLIPDEFQVSEALMARLVDRFELDPDAVDLTLPQRRLLAFCREQNLRCLDLLPVLEAAPGRVYGVRNTHWNLAGNRLAAEAMAEFLSGSSPP